MLVAGPCLWPWGDGGGGRTTVESVMICRLATFAYELSEDSDIVSKNDKTV